MLMALRFSSRLPQVADARTGRPGLLLAALAMLLLFLGGCSGGSTETQGQSTPLGTSRAQAVGNLAAGNVTTVSVDALVLKAERRVSRTVFDYDYQVTLNNQGSALNDVVVQLVAAGVGTTILDGNVNAGFLAANSATTPADTITIRQDRTRALDLAQLSWRINAAPTLITGTAAVGAALANANVSVTDGTGANVCAEPTIVTNGTGSFTCTVLAGRTAPFLVVVTEPFGAYPPMVSIVSSTPAPGTALVTNATPLTTAIVSQLAPDGNALSVVADPSLIDLNALASITANVLTQLSPVLSALGAPANYDPFTTQIIAGTATQSGNTADQLLEILRFSTVNGINQVAVVDNPGAAVPLADATTTSPPPVPAPSTTVLSLVDSMRVLTNALTSCFALSVNSRVLATDTSIPAKQGGPEVTSLALPCQRITHQSYVHMGYRTGQRYYGLLVDPSMVGATFNPPEILLFIDDTTAADNDVAVLNIRFTDANGVVGNIIENAQKIPGSATASHPTDWWIYGNQQPVETFVRSFIRRNEQFAPNPGTGVFVNASASRFEAGIDIFINKDGPGSTGMRAARVKGPGLPPAGVVLTRPDPAIITDQTWMNIRRKDGLTDPASATFATDVGNIFRLQRTWGLTGADATTVRPNPNASNTNNTAFPQWAHPLDYGAALGATDFIDFSQLKANSIYSIEVFYDGETLPRYTFNNKRMVTPVTPAVFAVNLQWNAPTPATLRYLDPADPLGAAQSSMNIAWAQNPFAETIRSVGVYTFGGGVSIADAVIPVPRGATSATAVAPGPNFPTLTSDGTSSRYIQLRYRMLDGSYKDSMSRFN
jgi:hypothetical protein